MNAIEKFVYNKNYNIDNNILINNAFLNFLKKKKKSIAYGKYMPNVQFLG